VFCFIVFCCWYQCNQLPGKTCLPHGLQYVKWDVKCYSLIHLKVEENVLMLRSLIHLCCIVSRHCRQLDLPLSLIFYKWLLGLESTLSLSDMHHVDPVLAASLQQLHDVVIQKKNLEADASHVGTEHLQ